MLEIVTLDKLNAALVHSPHKWELIYESVVKETLNFRHISVYAAGHVLLSVASDLGSEILDSLSVYAFHSEYKTFCYDAQFYEVPADQVADTFAANVEPALTDEYFLDNYIDTSDVSSLYRCFKLGETWD